MQSLTIDNQTVIPLTIVAKKLGVTIQRVHQLCEDQRIDKIKINRNLAVIPLEDFEKLENTPRITGRPTTKK